MVFDYGLSFLHGHDGGPHTQARRASAHECRAASLAVARSIWPSTLQRGCVG